MTSKKKAVVKEVDYMTLAKEVVNEHNLIRSDPAAYAEKLKAQLKYFKSDVLHRPANIPIRTYEGKAAFEEAIEFLHRQKPVGILIENDKLNQACVDHLNDIGPKGLCSHDGSDGSNPSDRIEKYCEWDLGCSENIDFGSKSAEDVVILLVVDDGIPERNHRKNLFNPELRYIGVASGPHKEFDHCTILDYVADIRNIGEPSKHKANLVDELLKNADKKKTKAVKNPYQENDPDAPDDTVSVKLTRTTKILNGKPTKITKKTYTLSDNTLFVVEIIEPSLII
jgi:hypothetical protein